ncbi:MAG: prepilin peptidase [Nitrosopumilus sp.]
MIEIESIRIILLLVMLGIASYFDIKTRMVPDVIWLVFGGIGAVLYFFDYQTVTGYHIIAMIMGGFASFMIWRWKLVGSADVFAVLTMTVILPVHYEFVMIPIAILIGSFVIMEFVTMIHCVMSKIRYKTSLNQVKSQPFVAYLFGVSVFLLLSEILSWYFESV